MYTPDFSVLKSRTFWTVVATMVIVDGNMLLPFLPPSVEGIAVVVLGALAVYFHVNPSQNYNLPS